MNIPIKEIKRIREELNFTHIVIFGVDANNKQYVATHGLTAKNAKEAAEAGNKLKSVLGWPEALCNDKPLERICKNCNWYEPDYGIFCANGWTRDGSDGYCLLEPEKIPTKANSKCSFFEPRI